MAKARSNFICQSCGAVSPRWQGKCEACGEWNSFVEEAPTSGIGAAAARGAKKGRIFALEGLSGESKPAPRVLSGLAELDRVTGGGFVPGSVLLIGGEPGIGKSTLLIQACAMLARKGERVVYISGEEAAAQVRLRAERLGLADAPVELAAETSVEDIIATLSAGRRPALVVIDSIQTMWTDTADATAGTVTQVRGAAQALIRFAKLSGACVILVGHVTKDGQIAGPRVVEHMVDAVASFEGDGSHHFRILRNVKNRFGPTDEIGVFEMTGGGLTEVANPSALFLAGRDGSAAGAAVFAGMEGTRPVLVEIQALVAPSALGTPRRAVVGWDPSRLSMLVAVLEAHGRVKLGQHDIYLNVAGGMKIAEPAADLAAAAALVSSLVGAVLPQDMVFFGEVGLSGAVRPVPHAGLRLKEASKLGFSRAVAPQGADGRASAKGETPKGMGMNAIRHIGEAIAEIAALGRKAPNAPADR
ncbi:DNA replication and repair protein RadA [Rhodoblastus acidophilus]|uniref:DNA repair protein RadA n=1 Tax=Rhodoblastus acidophilus TaxID=1074 RepID=A0A212RFG6_RHOAC|nr:DNA repair protein RadA [Rhodoblastus acidophilus]PPQ39661.1 DNA repair protein RadA [Rhodoblastus acidophilus]RAI24443.1 DNA repair protein RadA [Rhodoblastus acidophilus]SNB71105.1 DNA replication and repair protein RadA [Rhodoblastus acidophilus]